MPPLSLLEEGMRISGETHAQNFQAVAQQRHVAADLFRDHDVLLAPSAIGEAPAGLTTTACWLPHIGCTSD